MSVLVKQLAEELNIEQTHAENAIHLLFEEKGTIPFITRYRKEKTGSMSEVILSKLRDRYTYMQELEATKTRYLKVIEEHAKEKPDVATKLPQLRDSIVKCTSKQELEDIYLPFKPKRRTRAMTAKEKGLEPLLQQIFAKWSTLSNLNELAKDFVKTEDCAANLQVPDEESALKGASDIFAEQINETAEYRNTVRRISKSSGFLVAKKNDRFPQDEDSLKIASKYENYFEYKEDINKAPSHRVMAVRRGEAEKILIVNIEVDEETIKSELYQAICEDKGSSELSSEMQEWLQRTISDSYKRLISPAIETEIRMEIKMRSENEAIKVFASNLRNLLLLPPTPSHVVCGVDPGLRTGSKLAIVSQTGTLLEHCVLYPKLLKSKARKEKRPVEKETLPLDETQTDTVDGNAKDSKELDGNLKAVEEERPLELEKAPKNVQENFKEEEEEVNGNLKEEFQKPSPTILKATTESAQPEDNMTQAEKILSDLFQKHKVTCIALGNGTGSREIDQVILKVLRREEFKHIKRYIVNESGASVYSTDDIAREEFPDLDPTIRSAVSIARRLQDPLAELVKIDPRSLGVGQYQHDCEVSKLDKSLQETVESCVNSVGVDLNTASFKLLSYVSGIGHSLAKNIVSHRDEKGSFTNRKDLMSVGGFGPKTFEQAAGFLRVANSENPLDNSAVHPERYEMVEKIASDLGLKLSEVVGKEDIVKGIPVENYVTEDVGMPTLLDIKMELAKPGRDPREDNERIQYSSDITSINDLKLGMKMRGSVSNVTKFGCFVDIGVHQDGLVHISELPPCNGDPASIVSVGEILEVYVKGVDYDRNRISLSTKKDCLEAQAPRGLKPSNGPAIAPVKKRASEERPAPKPSGGFALKPVDPSAPKKHQERRDSETRFNNGGNRDSRPSHSKGRSHRSKHPRQKKENFSMDDLLSKFNTRS